MGQFEVYPRYNITVEKAKGSQLWAADGEKYLDMYGGHAVISVGHGNEHYINMIKEQLDRVGFYSNSVQMPQQEVLAQKLEKLSGKSGYNLFLCNSGAEANENAIKLASFHNGKKKVLAFTGSFHGRTSLAVAVTDDKGIQAPVNVTDNVVMLPYNDEAALEEAFGAGDVSSVIIEAIQGVGGIASASDAFLKKIRSLCDVYGAVMIADCVQCGCGRTGKYFALDHSGVRADIYTMAKGIGNGFPVGAIMISPAIRAVFGMLGTTFGGSYLACAAVTAVADEMERFGLMENAKKTGEYLISGLQALGSDKIIEIRGRGLMIGIVLNGDASAVRSELLMKEHVFVGSAKDKRIIRLLPSLTVTRQECDMFLSSLKNVLQR